MYGDTGDEEVVRAIAAVLRRFGGASANERKVEEVAREWFAAGFEDPDEVEGWLRARCPTAAGASSLESAGITPEQAAALTTAGASDSEDTIAAKVLKGELSFDEARRIITSEFWNS